MVVLGGGLLGIEAAAALRLRGREVTLVHRHGWLLDRQLDAAAGDLLAQALQRRGIVCRLGESMAKIDIDSVTLTSGDRLTAAQVLIAIGITPAAALARAAGVPCGRGILTDRQLRSAVHGVSALGECCEIDGETFGLVAPCLAQAEVLAHRLAGGDGGFSLPAAGDAA